MTTWNGQFDTGHHRDTVYGFRFVPDEGNPINIETQIILPDWNTPEIFDGQTFRVVYLDDDQRNFKNEAIDIEILSGKNAGFHDSYYGTANREVAGNSDWHCVGYLWIRRS